MKHNAILTNAGHFDCEVDVAALADMAVKKELRRDSIEGYTLPDGRVLNVIGEGRLRLVNLAAGNGHPAEIHGYVLLGPGPGPGVAGQTPGWTGEEGLLRARLPSMMRSAG